MNMQTQQTQAMPIPHSASAGPVEGRGTSSASAAAKRHGRRPRWQPEELPVVLVEERVLQPLLERQVTVAAVAQAAGRLIRRANLRPQIIPRLRLDQRPAL